jgi:hypothetical protein
LGIVRLCKPKRIQQFLLETESELRPSLRLLYAVYR